MEQGIALTQVLLIGLGFYIFHTLGLGITFSGAFYFSPLPMSLVVGIVLGDVPKAMLIGAELQLMYLGIIAPGGARPADPSIAALVATSLAISSNMSPELAVAAAVPAGLLGEQLNNLTYIINGACIQLADKYAEEGNSKGIFFAGAILPALPKIILTIPLMVIVYLGPTVGSAMINMIPAWLTNGLAVVGKILPALGISIAVTSIGKKNLLPYFLLGFFIVQYLSIPILPLAIFGSIMAYLHIVFTNKDDKLPGFSFDTDGESQVYSVLSKKDINKAFFIWWTFGESNHNFERYQAATFTMALSPIINKLYEKKEDRIAAFKRHLIFFNTEALFGSVIPGIAIAMEEQKSLGADIPVEAITGVKTGLMGPVAGIGDTLTYGITLPIILSLFIPWAKNGSWIAGFAPPIVFAAITIPVGLALCRLGYKMGSKSVAHLLKLGIVNKIIQGASILGLFIMGGLAASYIIVATPITFNVASNPMPLQEILDSILKGILPLLTLTGIYTYINKFKGTYFKATLLVFAVGLILGAVGIIA